MRPGEESFFENYQLGGVGSGVGSEPAYCRPLVEYLSRFVRRYGIRSVLDYGCGDWQWARLVDWADVDYMGVDIVPILVDRLRREHGGPRRRFELVPGKLPAVDLVICKDVAIHLPNEEIAALAAKFSARAAHVLWVNSIVPNVNAQIERGGCRGVDMGAPPFNVSGNHDLRWGDAGTCEGLKTVFHAGPTVDDFKRSPTHTGNLASLVPHQITGRKVHLGGQCRYVVPASLDVDVLVTYGIGPDCSFERDFRDRYHVPVYCFDHMIDALPGTGNEGLVWTREAATRGSVPRHLATFAGKRIALKMDVEEAEWEALTDVTFDGVELLVIELHWLSREPRPLLQRIARLFDCVHVHGCNFGPRDEVVEATFVRKDGHAYPVDLSPFPGPLDQPDDPSEPDWTCTWWKLPAITRYRLADVAPILAQGALPDRWTGYEREPTYEVPRRLHFVWIGSELPAHYRDNVLGFVRLNPGHEVVLWVDHPCAVDGVTVRSVSELAMVNRDLYDAETNQGARADILRVEAVHVHGGTYLDIDTIALRGFDERIGRQAWVAACPHMVDHNVCNGFFSMPARSTFLRFVLDCLRRTRGETTIPRRTGGTMLTACVLSAADEQIQILEQGEIFMGAAGGYMAHLSHATWQH